MTLNIKQCQQAVEQIFEAEHFEAEPQSLYAPIAYTLRLGGKRLRPTLLVAANSMLGGSVEQVRFAALGIEVFHNFTLLHDDLMDRSPLRRGKPTVYQQWGANAAVLSGDTMYTLAWDYFLRQPLPRMHEVLQCFCHTALEVCEGQQYDMDFEQHDDVSISQYLMMIRKKTAVLLAGALKIGALCADADAATTERLYDFGIHLGLAFQLQDDLLDAYGDTAQLGKATGQDIRDNKKTYLMLRALELGTESQTRELRQLFAAGSEVNEEEKVKRTLAIYNEVGLKEGVEKAIDGEFALAAAELDTIGVSAEAKCPLREVLAMLDGRKK
ncbi:MAG: polyprenyl synthetase family protein [Bacteroidales bacterium]|nr:polyprenyl synthetase family protein [Bacteroidales bacterium]